MNRIRGTYAPPYKYDPEEIQNSIFLPMMKKALISWGRPKTRVSLIIIIYIFNPPFCRYATGHTGADFFRVRGVEFFVFFGRDPDPDKNRYAPLDEKNPGHASLVKWFYLYTINYTVSLYTWQIKLKISLIGSSIRSS